MAATDVTVQQDAGTAQQLPQGAATQLNDALPTETASPPQDAQAATPTAAPQRAMPADYQPKFQPSTPDEAFITGPTSRPNEPVTAGSTARARGALPPDFGAWFPAFVEAAQTPGAPAQLQALVATLQEMNH